MLFFPIGIGNMKGLHELRDFLDEADDIFLMNIHF